MCCAAAVSAQAEPVALHIDAIDHPAFTARQIVARVDSLSGGAGELDIGRLTVAGRTFAQLHLRCGTFRWSAQGIECRRGQLQPAGFAPLPVDFLYVPAQGRLDLMLGEGALATLPSLLPELAAWQPRGLFSARLRLDAARVDLHLQLREAAFADHAGKIAGEHIGARLDASLVRQGKQWRWRGELAWPQGEAYVAPLYRKAGMTLSAAGQYAANQLNVDQATLNIDGIGTLDGRMQWLMGGGLRNASLTSGALDLGALVQQGIQPFIDAQAGPKLSAAGQGRIALALDGQGMARVDIEVHDGRLGAGAASMRGIEARIPWRRETATQASIHVAGGEIGRLALGAIDLPLAMRGFEFSLPRVDIPLLDGEILLEDFHAARAGNQWQWRLAGALYPISMPLLSEALGWPRMEGRLSAMIPRIEYANRTLGLDGTLVVALFDGYLSASGLKVIDPFGALPRVQTEIEARHLDLGMLTHTFSFGDITGYIDADIKGLDMAGRRPLAFEAQIHSSDGDYVKRISQRAVQNISSLGGAGAGAAIQRSFLHFFDTFGYDKLGLSCRLINDVCLMDGVAGETTPAGYMIIKGGGIPALSVIGYNRRVNWDELVSRVQAVIAGNSKIEIR